MNNSDNEMQARLNKLITVTEHTFAPPFKTIFKGRSEILYGSAASCIGYIHYKYDYHDYLPVLNSPATFVDLELDYSEGYTLFCMLTGLNRTFQCINANPITDAGQYRLWILRYGKHYVVIEVNYDKLREAVREHHFQATFTY